MRFKLQFASLITLGIIATFLFSIILLIAYELEAISAPFLIIGTIVLNFIVWLVSPYIQTFIYRLVYKVKFYTIDEFASVDAKLTKFIRDVCAKNNLKRIPRIGLIDDDNPTAFTYGSAAFNARIVFTKGLYTYLEENERNAVIAHEIGHILHRDFIVMTIAATMVQLLYEIYRIFMRAAARSSGGGKKGNGKAVALVVAVVSLIFYWIASYLLLYLSRVREYYADQFAAQQVGHPDYLSMAFIKIAYGIVAKKDTKKSENLLNSTRALGISDTKTAKNMGVAYVNLSQRADKLDNVMLFDLVSPWATVLEFGSTHPLTGKRIRRLSGMAKDKGLTSIFDFDDLVRKEVDVDKGKLYKNFFRDVWIYYLPVLLTLAIVAYALIADNLRIFTLIPAAAGLGLLLKNEYKFTSNPAKPMTVLELMSDIYASPIRGTPALLDGKVIGRGTAGYYFSEDMMMQDNTGLMYLNYQPVIPFFGNLIFAWKKVKQLMGRPIKAEGWFIRGLTQRLDLRLLTADGTRIKSAIKIWSIIGGLLLIGLGIFLYFFIGQI